MNLNTTKSLEIRTKKIDNHLPKKLTLDTLAPYL